MVLVTSPWSALHLQIHQFAMCHQALIQVGRDHERPSEYQDHDESAERESQDVVGVVRPGRDVKEEYEVHSHLGDG